MNDVTNQDASPAEQNSSEGTAKIIYVLYLLGFLTGGLTSIIGVIMAYINKSSAAQWLQSHYQFQVRTFWMGFLYSFIGFSLANYSAMMVESSPSVAQMISITSGIVLLFWFVWAIVRCVKGLKLLGNNEPHPDPTSWMF